MGGVWWCIAIMQHVTNKQPGAFFIDGPGGTGKTFLYKALYAEIRLMNKIVLPTATSGIAAANIPSGRTAHSRFKIPIDSDSSRACVVPKQGSLAALLKEATLIIWDEASMAHKENLESLDMLFLRGSFRQVLPVVPHKTQREAVGATVVTSYLWPKLTKFKLTENIRARDDPQYSIFLLSLGNGELQQTDNGYVQLPMEIVRPLVPDVDPVKEIMKAILTPMNDDVDLINAVMIEEFPGDPVVYKSFDSVLDDMCNVCPTEFINKLCPGGMSPHELMLKEDCPVILLHNILPSSGLCNGTRLICKKFFPNVIMCVIAVGQYAGQHVLIHRVRLRPSASSKYPFQFERNQFPIKLSFAMTINKCQRQTLNQVCVYLPRPCFSHGQLYVALSRAKEARKITVHTSRPPAQYTANFTKNVVSYDVLRLTSITQGSSDV
ncbi:uncharacterized protein LOC110684876 [Chenopodium quinoa]|uniref:uncharacterized protein LOC110684876 n=1 Tax=Chenopodium quinoa TaxID=63459 RepID=UPI000B78E0E3|nr:uncharacterized protein LOC110684876 [Chenopodium quinoa]